MAASSKSGTRYRRYRSASFRSGFRDVLADIWDRPRAPGYYDPSSLPKALDMGRPYSSSTPSISILDRLLAPAAVLSMYSSAPPPMEDIENVMLNEIQDRRRFMGSVPGMFSPVVAPALDIDSAVGRYTTFSDYTFDPKRPMGPVRQPTPGRHVVRGDVYKIRFIGPRRMLVCIRRAARRAAVFAHSHGRPKAATGPHRQSEFSRVTCYTTERS